MKATNIISWVLRLVAAIIMLQTLYFKFSAAPESIYIFTQVGLEPWGRIGTGVAELIASLLLLIPATIAIGALLSIGVMLGAVVVHLFILGINVQGDGGQLFLYAMIVLIASVVLLVMYRDQLTPYRKMLFKA
jgi:hypothetical protein